MTKITNILKGKDLLRYFWSWPSGIVVFCSWAVVIADIISILDSGRYGYKKRDVVLLATATLISISSLFYSIFIQDETSEYKKKYYSFNLALWVVFIALMGTGAYLDAPKKADAELFTESIEKQIQSLHFAIDEFSDGRTNWKDAVQDVERNLEEMEKRVEEAKQHYIHNNKQWSGD